MAGLGLHFADPVLQAVALASLALVLATALAMAHVLVLSELANRRRRRRLAFDARWGPRLAEASLAASEAPPWPAPAEGETLWFLVLWARTQRALRGPAHARLGRLLVRYGLDRQALALLARRPLHERLVGLSVLRQLGDPAHWPLVEPLLDDANPFLSLAAADALVAIDPARAMARILPRAVDRVDWTALRVAGFCRQAGRDAVTPPLLRLLDGGDEATAARCAPLLAWADPARLAPWARDRLAPGTAPGVRAAALELLGTLHDPADGGALSAALDDPDAGCRLAAVLAFARQAGAADAARLATRLRDTDWSVRQAAADALVRLPGLGRDALGALLAAETDRYARDALRRALAEAAP